MYKLFVILIEILHLSRIDSFDNLDLISLLAQRDPNITYHSPIPDKLVNEYLQQHGYLNFSLVNSNDILDGLFLNQEAFTESIKKFQKFSGLNETGVLDEETKEKMGAPRCGMADINEEVDNIKKRSITKWSKSVISYKISQNSGKLNSYDSRNGLIEAFGLWSAVVPLTFYETNTKGDIDIRFVTGKHNDAWPFDGSGGTLAHASLGNGGFLHFDDAENWKYVKMFENLKNNEIDYLNIATHEIGHVLGLKHSEDPNSIMTPFYRANIDQDGNYIKPRLAISDIRNIQNIYGMSSEQNALLLFLSALPQNNLNQQREYQNNVPSYNHDFTVYKTFTPSLYFFLPFFP